MEYEVYTDGAYAPSRNEGGYAFVILKDRNILYKGYNSIMNTTNNRMEILSVIQAINCCIKYNINSFKLYSDSLYVINTMKGLYQRKKNLDLWKILDEKVIGLDIDWTHLDGHSGDTYNEYCDKLAVFASTWKKED